MKKNFNFELCVQSPVRATHAYLQYVNERDCCFVGRAMRAVTALNTVNLKGNAISSRK